VTPFLAVFTLAFRSVHRSHPLRALAALFLLAAGAAPSLVAFAFAGDDALAVSGAVGSAALLAPAAALFGGLLLAAGDRGGDGLLPLLRGPAGPAAIVGAAATGISAAAIIYSGITAIAAFAALAWTGRPFDAGNCIGAILAAWAAAPAAAAAGLLLAVAAPRPLASALAVLLAAGLLAAPGVRAAGSVLLLARDAAFGGLPSAAVALSCGASLAAAAALVSAAAALLRAKDLAPRPGDA